MLQPICTNSQPLYGTNARAGGLSHEFVLDYVFLGFQMMDARRKSVVVPSLGRNHQLNPDLDVRNIRDVRSI